MNSAVTGIQKTVFQKYNVQLVTCKIQEEFEPLFFLSILSESFIISLSKTVMVLFLVYPYSGTVHKLNFIYLTGWGCSHCIVSVIVSNDSCAQMHMWWHCPETCSHWWKKIHIHFECLLLSFTLALLRFSNYSANLSQCVWSHLLLLSGGITIPAVWKDLNILSFDR